MKLARHPFEVAQAVIDTYSKQGPDSIAKVPGEVERLKWVGMYPQRQGGDAFMMRIKVPGGVMTAPQVREIGVAADAFAEGPDDSPVFGNRYADLTTRQDIQLHWIRIADVPRIWRRWRCRADDGAGVRRLRPQCLLVPGVGHRRRRGRRCLSRRRQAISSFSPGTVGTRTCRASSRLRVTGCHGGLRPVEINDIGLWPARSSPTGGRLQCAHRRWALRRRAHGVHDIDLFIRPDQAVELQPRRWPRSSASSATGRTAAWHACATSLKS